MIASLVEKPLKDCAVDREAYEGFHVISLPCMHCVFAILCHNLDGDALPPRVGYRYRVREILGVATATVYERFSGCIVYDRGIRRGIRSGRA